MKLIRSPLERGSTVAGVLIGVVLGAALLIFAIIKFLIPGE